MIVSAIITAAGSGNRFGEQKQFKQLKGTPLYFYSLKQFLLIQDIEEIILIVPKSKLNEIQIEIANIQTTKKIIVVAGGKRRQDSVKNGIMSSSDKTELVCIHDGARPFISIDLIKKSISACSSNDGAIIAVPNYDTLKMCIKGYIKKTIDRKNIWFAQTPQTFWKSKLIGAIEYAEKNELTISDEASIMEALGFNIYVIDGDNNNFKITSPNDWKRAEKVII